MELYRLRPGQGRLVVSVPHAGTYVPDALAARLVDGARSVPDADRHVDRLYDFAAELDATILVATHARYVVDLNRPPDDAPLYPGQAGTGLCPLTTFDGEPLYRPGQAPDGDEIRARVVDYWQPWHDRLGQEIERIRRRHGGCVLWDAHSIASRVPRLFDGELPVLNLGTNGGRSCRPERGSRLAAWARDNGEFSAVVNGRFKGGYITRHYGQPDTGVEAIQLELAQRAYMDESPPWDYDPVRADRLRAVLRRLLEIAAAPAPWERL